MLIKREEKFLKGKDVVLYTDGSEINSTIDYKEALEKLSLLLDEHSINDDTMYCFNGICIQGDKIVTHSIDHSVIYVGVEGNVFKEGDLIDVISRYDSSVKTRKLALVFDEDTLFFYDREGEELLRRDSDEYLFKLNKTKIK